MHFEEEKNFQKRTQYFFRLSSHHMLLENVFSSLLAKMNFEQYQDANFALFWAFLVPQLNVLYSSQTSCIDGTDIEEAGAPSRNICTEKWQPPIGQHEVLFL